jgi:hypothetical protein
MIADEPRQTPTPDPKDQGNDAKTGADAPARTPEGGDATPPAADNGATAVTPALARFHSCRWRAQPEDGVFCTHRDVLPMAGKTGFSADSWCPDCQYFKVRRAPRKREREYSY